MLNSPPSKAPAGYFNNPISETGPDQRHVVRPPGFFDRKPINTPHDIVPMLDDDEEDFDLRQPGLLLLSKF